MLASVRLALIPAIVTGWLLAAGPAQALTPKVKDDGGFFSPDAVKRADQEIKEIKQRFNKDLVVETYATVPANKVEQVKKLDRNARRKFFADWVDQRARDQGVDGIVVLICKDPASIEVGVGLETRKRDFTLDNRDHLVRLLVEEFKAKKYDEGLIQGVQYVHDTISSNHGGARADARHRQGPVGHAPDGGWFGGGVQGWICTGLVVLAVIWLVFGLIRAVAGMGHGGGYGPGGGGYGYGGGGGSFMSGLMGGLLHEWAHGRPFRSSCGELALQCVLGRAQWLWLFRLRQ
jgi:uncharacterized membrane protein YgcG